MNNKSNFIWIALLLTTVFMLWHGNHRQQQNKLSAQSTTIALEYEDFADTPEQYETSKPAFKFKEHTVKPLAEFRIRARIMSRENYSFDGGAKISPVDFALGWQRMADPQIYEALNIRQSGRWYRYSWRDEPPIPLNEIIVSSANMHMIPANDEIKQILAKAKAGQMIRLQGQLVEVTRGDNWRWRSSLTRTDSGDGACELVFVEAAALEL